MKNGNGMEETRRERAGIRRGDNSGWGLGLLGLIAGLLIGWGVTAATTPDSSLPTVGVGGSPDGAQSATSKASNLRINLNSLLREHGVVGLQFLQNVYDGKETDALTSMISTNSNNILDLVGMVWGNEAKDEFGKMWTDHMNLYRTYTEALKNKDNARKTEAKQDLQELADKMGNAFSSRDQKVNAGDFSRMMEDHINITLDTIETYAAGDNDAVTNNMKEGYDQAGVFADFLTNAALNANPDLFR